MALHVKKGDMVEIISGAHKGATGRILRVIRSKNKVVVQGHNVAKKHVRPSRRNPQGGRISVEQPIHISNVLPITSKSSKGKRVHYVIGQDGSKKRVTTDGSELSAVRRGKDK